MVRSSVGCGSQDQFSSQSLSAHLASSLHTHHLVASLGPRWWCEFISQSTESNRITSVHAQLGGEPKSQEATLRVCFSEFYDLFHLLSAFCFPKAPKSWAFDFSALLGTSNNFIHIQDQGTGEQGEKKEMGQRESAYTLTATAAPNRERFPSLGSFGSFQPPYQLLPSLP